VSMADLGLLEGQVGVLGGIHLQLCRGSSHIPQGNDAGGRYDDGTYLSSTASLTSSLIAIPTVSPHL
jgi:hypothetical protein